jgi:acyl-coenzyme A synthetase/AMP-(fatty) acid ligase
MSGLSAPQAPALGATWYYAAPTMHAMILNEVERRRVVPGHSVRFIGNAAGPLLPQLARQLKDTFGCVRASGLAAIL